jgi:hypothetical protein
MKNSKPQTPNFREAPNPKLQIKAPAQRIGISSLVFLWSLKVGVWSFCGFPPPALAADALSLSWTNNLLTLSSSTLPGGKLDIWYLEAFCHKGSTHRDWGKTTLPHKTVLLSSEPRHLRFRTIVKPEVEMLHDVRAGADGLEFEFQFKNQGSQPVDLEWFQPACIRVQRFTGLDQTNYAARSFIYTASGLTTLDKTRRAEEALYRGGQVYVPSGINLDDVNPRPISPEQPVNGLIGCFSADGKYLMATASDSTHELFEGVFVCLHNDPHVGGLRPGETKRIRAKIYLLENDPQELLRRYRKDFPEKPTR